jgi:hypothetical protein
MERNNMVSLVNPRAGKGFTNHGSQDPFSRSQGMSKLRMLGGILLIQSAYIIRPVVVAENMIGVAMYELVSSQLNYPILRHLYI